MKPWTSSKKPFPSLSFSPCSSPQHAIIQPGLAWGVWLPAGGKWTQLYPVCGGGQQRPPGRVAGWGPSPGDRRSQCVRPGSTGRDCHCPDSEEHPPQYRSGVPHSAGLKDSLNTQLQEFQLFGRKMMLSVSSVWDILMLDEMFHVSVFCCSRWTSSQVRMVVSVSPSWETAPYW